MTKPEATAAAIADCQRKEQFHRAQANAFAAIRATLEKEPTQ